MEFKSLLESEDLAADFRVDEQEWAELWSESWVVFADLLGFAQQCLESDASTVNSVVRFHRATSAAVSTLSSFRLYRFTDASFLVTAEPRTALAFAANIQNECLARNALKLQREGVRSHELLYPRVTIANGRVLTVPAGAGEEDARLFGVDPERMLAGEGIVRAYQIEKKTGALMVSFDKGEATTLRRLGVRYAKNRANALYRRWGTGPSMWRFKQSGLLDHPWPLLQARQGSKGPYASEPDTDLKRKLQTLLDLQRVWLSGFVIRRDPVDVSKHHGSLTRFLIDLVQSLHGLGRRRWDIRDLAAAVDSM